MISTFYGGAACHTATDTLTATVADDGIGGGASTVYFLTTTVYGGVGGHTAIVDILYAIAVDGGADGGSRTVYILFATIYDGATYRATADRLLSVVIYSGADCRSTIGDILIGKIIPTSALPSSSA